jgi:hypothetical protein
MRRRIVLSSGASPAALFAMNHSCISRTPGSAIEAMLVDYAVMRAQERVCAA